MIKPIDTSLSDPIYEKKAELAILEHNKKINEYIDTLEEAKKWVKAKEGDKIGYGNYYVQLESLILRSAFMGFGTGKSKEIKFPKGELANIFGEPIVCGSASLTNNLIKALIEVLKSARKS